jgi:phosphatidylserine/phosphatidylglycerophosphate/cardiolipin synthase-like enzyme
MASTMLSLTSTGAMIHSFAGARDVAVEAYTLRGPIVFALERAARHGTHVTVRLEAHPNRDRKGALREYNAKVARELRGAGAVARLQDRLHVKAVAVDDTLYLDERNWNRDDVVLRDDDPGDWPAIPAMKDAALAEEAQLLARARKADGVIVESESFGTGNPVYSALKALGCAGAAPRLLVTQRDLHGSRRERAALEKLASNGVRVRVCADSMKGAVAGDHVWLGSANATYCGDGFNMSDWGLRTSDRAIVDTVRTRLESEWRTARQFEP